MKYDFDDATFSDLHKEAYGFRPDSGDQQLWDCSSDDSKQEWWNEMCDEMTPAPAMLATKEARKIDEVQQFKDALTHPKFCYTRARNPSRMDGNWTTTDELVIFVYCIDEGGIKRSHGGLPYNEAIPIIDEMRKSFPLSPTEGLGCYGI